ncbi:MAG: 2-oxoacid:acceptor oxidoreductase family protein [Clostridiaceae bacterium]|nr:2-oxoacid:acceptor oxidoreductase family protein [Clostridiaceae bacterium]
MVEQQIIIAGFGGQGVLSMGQILSYAGLLEGKNVSWLPSYGPEMRGGTANCNVIISEELVGSPIVKEADAAIIMNLPSLEKFEKFVVSGGNLLINSSLISEKTSRGDVKAYEIPANDIANEIGNAKVANMVMLGAYIELTKIVAKQSIIQSVEKVLGSSKGNLIQINEEALKRGAESVKCYK